MNWFHQVEIKPRHQLFETKKSASNSSSASLDTDDTAEDPKDRCNGYGGSHLPAKTAAKHFQLHTGLYGFSLKKRVGGIDTGSVNSFGEFLFNLSFT